MRKCLFSYFSLENSKTAINNKKIAENLLLEIASYNPYFSYNSENLLLVISWLNKIHCNSDLENSETFELIFYVPLLKISTFFDYWIVYSDASDLVYNTDFRKLVNDELLYFLLCFNINNLNFYNDINVLECFYNCCSIKKQLNHTDSSIILLFINQLSKIKKNNSTDSFSTIKSVLNNFAINMTKAS